MSLTGSFSSDQGHGLPGRQLSNASVRLLSLYQSAVGRELSASSGLAHSAEVNVVSPSDENLEGRKTMVMDQQPEKQRRRSMVRYSVVMDVEPFIQVTPEVDVHLRCEGMDAISGVPVTIKSELHHIMYMLAQSSLVTNTTSVLIIINCVLFILLCFPAIEYRIGWYTRFFNSILLGVLITEMILKIYAYRSFYFKDNWNLFDMFVNIFGVFDYLATWLIVSYPGFRRLLIVRLLQVFRMSHALLSMPILRGIRFILQTKALLETLLKSLKDLTPAWLLMMLFTYMFAVIGVSLFGDIDYRFSGLPTTLWTLFELMTCDDWFFIVVDIGHKEHRPFVIVYCFLFIVILCYVIFSLFIAILVDNFYLMRQTIEEENRRKKMCRKENTDYDKGDDFLDNVSDSDNSDADNEGNESKTIGDYYPHITCHRTLAILERHFQLLASLDYHKYQLDRLHHLIDQLVDMTTIVSEPRV